MSRDARGTAPPPHPPGDGLRLTVKIAVVESTASWLVRRAMELGYRRATGQEPPTARDEGVPLRRIVAWAAVCAAGVAAADVAADRLVLRRAHVPEVD